MKFLKNRRAWRLWANGTGVLGIQPPKEFPCYAIPTHDGEPYYLYKSEIGDMAMRLALTAMESPI